MDYLKTPSSKSEYAPRTRKQYNSRGNRSVDSSSSIASGRLTSLINIEENMASFALSPAPSRLSVLSDNTDIQEPRRRSWWRKLDENSREIMDVFESNKNVEPNNFLEELDIEVLSQEQKNHDIDLPDSSESESIASIVMPQRRLFTQKENQPPKNLNALIGLRKSVDKHDKSKIIVDDVANVNKNKLFQSKTRSKPILSVAILNAKSDKTLNVTKESELPTGQVRNIFGHDDAGKRKDICTKFVGDGNNDLSINKTLIDNSEKRTKTKPVRNIFRNHSGNKRKNMFADFIGSESGSMSANETIVSKSKESEEMRNQVRNIFENATGVKRKNIFTEFVTIENEVLDKSQSRGLREPSPTSSYTTDIEIDDWKQLPSSTMMEHQLIDTIENSAKKSKLSQLKGDSSNANTIVNKTSQSNKSILLQNISKSSTDSVKDITKKMNMSVTQAIKNPSTKSIQNEHIIPKIRVNDESLNIVASKNNSVSNSCTKNSNITVINNSTRVQNNSKKSNTTNAQENNAKNQNNLHESSNKTFYENTIESTVSNLLKSKANKKDNENHKVNKVDNNKTDPSEEQIANHIMEGDEEVQDESETTAGDEMDYQQTESDQEVIKNSKTNDETNEQMEQSIQNESGADNNENDHQSVVDINGDENDETDGNESAVNKTDDENESVVNENDFEHENAVDNNDIENESAVNENDDKNESAVDANESVIVANDSAVDENDDENESAVDENDDENESTVDENHDENDSAVDPNEESAVEENDEENEGSNNENESGIDDNEVENESDIDENDVENESAVEANDEENESNNENESAIDENESAIDENDVENESAIEENDEENEGSNNENENAIDENESVVDENDVENESTSDENDDENEGAVDENEGAVNENETTTIDDGNEIAIDDNNEEDESTNEIPNHNKNEINIPESDNDENSESSPISRTAVQSSPEAILRLDSNHDVSYATRRNTLQATKYSIKDLNIKTSLMPLRESTRMSDGITNSSGEGSAWDSHRTTRKTLRQTFGRDFTIRKSLRAMVMEKSAKRQTEVNGLHANENSSKVNAMQSSFNLEDNQNISDHEDSRRMMQAELEMQQAELEMQKHVEELKERMFKMGEAAKKYFNNVKKEPYDPFKVPSKPKFTTRETKVAKKKVKKQYNYVIPKEMLPEEFLKDLKYKPPKRYQPKNVGWATKRLYKFLESKLEPHYAYRSRVRAERVVRDLYEFVTSIRRVQVAPPAAINGLKQELARLDIIRTHYDFFIFFHEYMPKELGFKVIPDLMNKLPLPRDLYGDILQDNR